ncbi:MAG: threonine/serine exporter family protein [Archangium sp.]
MADEPKLPAQLLLDYLVELGTALMSAGCPTNRLEDVIVAIAEQEGFVADVFAVPTGLFLSLRTPQGESPVVTMVRVREWKNDLHRLAALDEVLNEVADRTLTIPEARARIHELEHAKPVWPMWAVMLATIGASAGSSISFGGSVVDCAFAGLGGLLLRVMMLSTRNEPNLRLLENFLGGLIAGLVALLASQLVPGTSREVVVLATIIPLLPGLTLTTGLSEVAWRNLVAGSARLMQAAVTLLSLVFGIALIVGLEGQLDLPVPTVAARAAAPWFFQVIALPVATLSYGVLLGVGRKGLPVALASGALVWTVSAATRTLPGPHAAFVTAFVLAAAANIYARNTARPAQLFLMPGMLLLVPGALSFRSLETLLHGDVVTSASQAGTMIIIAGALVMGLLVSSVVVPAKKHL